MGTRVLPTGTVTFLFTDIEGSTSLLRRVGLPAYQQLLDEHRVLLRSAIGSHNGIEVNTEGDGTFVAFADPVDAVAACVDAQVALGSYPWSVERVSVRMGLHTGEAAATVDDDYVGMGVHQAARVASAAHGGQILLSPVTAEAVDGALPEMASLADLGAYHVRDFDDPIHLIEVRHPDLRVTAPPRVPSAVVHNLRPARTSFVGREGLVGELTKQVDTVGLLTLVGPGGVGKTRLATEVGLAVAGAFSDGVWLVELAGVSTPDGVTTAIASALDISLASADTPLSVLASALEGKRLLLMLDNCEHVVDAVAIVVDDLLAACPKLAVVATSREPLQIAAEWIVRVDPLGVPEPAVTLFANRAVQADRAFEVAPDDVEVVADICRRLDGIPLALELAAARIGTVPITALADQLGESISGLSRRGGPERHRTLEATVAWSVELLDDVERELLRRLAVFRGAFTAATAAEVCSDDVVPTGAVEPGLHALASRSLCEADWSASPPRFWLLETIREFVGRSFAESDPERRAQTSERLHGWACRFLEAYFSRRPVGGPEGVDAEHPNLLEAFEWAVATPGQADGAALLASRLVDYWDRIGQWQAAAERLARIPAPPDDSRRAGVLADRGRFAWHLGDYESATAWLEEAIAVWRATGEIRQTRTPLTVLGLIAQSQGDHRLAISRFTDVLDAARAEGDEAGVAVCHVNLGNIAHGTGDQALAREHYQAALEIGRAKGYSDMVMTCTANLGFVAWAEGDYADARVALTDALDQARTLGDRNNEGKWLGGLGLVAAAQGDFDVARRNLSAGLGIARELGNREEVVRGLGNLASVEADDGNPAESRRLNEEALGIARELGDTAHEAWHLSNIGAAAMALGDTAGAQSAYEAALELALGIDDGNQVAVCRAGLAELAVAEGDVAHAAELVGDALGSGALMGQEALSVLYLAAELVASATGRRILDSAEAWRAAQGGAVTAANRIRIDRLARQLPPAAGEPPLTLPETIALAQSACAAIAHNR